MLFSYSNQDMVVWAERYIHTSMKHDRKPRMDPHKYGQLIFDKDAKAIQ